MGGVFCPELHFFIGFEILFNGKFLFILLRIKDAFIFLIKDFSAK